MAEEPGPGTGVAEARVECYSGYTYAQEPRAFTWQGHHYAVAEIEARWRTPQGPAFRVCTDTARRFDLHYCERKDRWTVETKE